MTFVGGKYFSGTSVDTGRKQYFTYSRRIWVCLQSGTHTKKNNKKIYLCDILGEIMTQPIRIKLSKQNALLKSPNLENGLSDLL